MTRRTKNHRLSPRELTAALPPTWIPFKTSTAELPSGYRGTIGQERAMSAIELGLRIPARGFNVFAAGDPGSGKTSILERVLNEHAAKRRAPPDICYVHDFRFPDRPRPLLLPPGKGRKLAAEMERVVHELSRLVPRVLADPAFGHTRAGILADTHARSQQLTRKAAQAAQKLGLSIEEDETSLRVVPLHRGKPVTPEGFGNLPASRRRRIEAAMVAFQEHLDHYAHKRRQLELDHQSRLLAAEVRAITPLVHSLVGEVAERFARFGEDVADFLDQVEQHILDNHRTFLPPDTGEEAEEEEPEDELLAEGAVAAVEPDHRMYQVNVLVDRTGQTHGPVVLEQLPTAANLCGFFEYRHEHGRLVTDHTMIRAGALHHANGGYLLLQVGELLSHENSWEALKRALRHKNIRIEEEVAVGEGKTRIAGAMKPDPVPLAVKVVLVGSTDVYYLLKFEDEDFGRLFKVKAEFEPAMPRTRRNVERLARFLGQVCREEGYLPLHRDGLERLLEDATRRAEHKSRMTTHRADLLDVMAEANFYARAARARSIRGRDVVRAIAELQRRHGALADDVDRAIAEGAILIRTQGMAVGQLNGIALYDLAGISFGVPVRITVRTYAGRRGVVNIDREVELSGAIHDKGALILVGYLGGRYAQRQTLGLSASITFEQSYDEIDGDSASSAELYALLSSLSGCPIRQGIAVTGSVNQLGEVQLIGGVNEKIEGIFRVCRERGLSGEQGVMIPRANVANLMLSREVIEAVAAGRFHVYAVSTIDEGIEVLTGVAAGARRKDGAWTPGSINDRVERRLAELGEVVRTRGVITAHDSAL
jgi:lon-related putative ATP-dependent protease